MAIISCLVNSPPAVHLSLLSDGSGIFVSGTILSIINLRNPVSKWENLWKQSIIFKLVALLNPISSR